jgi:methylmalonyl-CoA mutase cobalamin-binding subunit
VQFGQRGTLLSVVTPLIHALGHGWQEGAVRTGAEHLGTAIIREYLLAPVAGSQCGENAPEIVIATPSGEVHELGAMLAASTARDLGWSVTYLGPNLPSEEIAACAKARNAKAVAVSVVYPGGSPGVTQQLSDLRRALPNQVALIIGGRVVDTYPDVLKQNHVYCISDLSGLEDLLAKLSCNAA